MEDNVKPIKILDVYYRGVDDFSRPVFKLKDRAVYFGSTSVLVPDRSKGLVDVESIVKYFQDNPNHLELFGSKFNCEPHGGTASNWKFNIYNSKNDII